MSTAESIGEDIWNGVNLCTSTYTVKRAIISALFCLGHFLSDSGAYVLEDVPFQLLYLLRLPVSLKERE